ncbi:SDR family NAD(P)-dependent oxidoreductase [archaeon]|jgi:UDP-glucuronate 4-epimerase|nr:SDR family NAD(P)-dependent oxidoreductase [archaeon]MBT4648443.1 SDR family NAD(P)-dependent oxidoreductase [archaeon]MBT6821749.1 SDR family NAD(P)-dependent oxidoreductase [archaeon]MBT7391221.1 SDR family NAD(P)-dependent oxidoreductase [archaeon]
MNNKTILVTGGAGFIGSHVCDRLLELGHKVICLDNLNNYYSPATKIENIKHNISNPNFILQVLSITKKEHMKEVFKTYNIDVVIHLAARAGVRPSIEHPLWYQETNVDGTVNLLELSKQHKVKKFIFGSSSSVYGENKKIPFSEIDDVNNPISPYAASKKACELFCYTYSYLTGLDIACLRFFTVYGPRGRPEMAIYLFTKWIMEGTAISMFGDGETMRDYTYISDIVNGIVSCIDVNFKYEIINLGNSNPIKLKNLVSTIEKITGKKAKIEQKPIPKGDVPLTYADLTKAKRLLNYEPKVSIEEGIKNFYEWFKTNKQ